MFGDWTFEYVAYLLLAIISSVFIWKSSTQLGRIIGFESIMQPMIQVATNCAIKAHSLVEKLLCDVKATRTYRSTHREYQHENFRTGKRKNKLPLRVRRKYTRYVFLLMLAFLKMKHASYSTNYTTYAATATGAAEPEPEPGPRPYPLTSRFDTDSFTLGLDGHASRCMSPDRNHFTDLKEWNGPPVKGIGTTTIEGVGTVNWDIECDKGQRHTLQIKDALYVTSLHKAILSPQHFAKCCNYTSTNDTCLITKAN